MSTSITRLIFNMKNRFNWTDRKEEQETQNIQPILINLPIAGQTKKIEMVDVKQLDAKKEDSNELE